MSEPTAEQVDQERERAWQFMKLAFGWDDSNRGQPWSQQAETDVADAFARVRIEAHAAGRDEGKADAFKECEGIARMLPQTPRVNVARAIADAISRRKNGLK